MQKPITIVFTLIQLIFTQKIDCQNIAEPLSRFNIHISLNQNNLLSVYEWRQEVCTLGCRATGSEGKLTLNGGISLEFPLSNGVY